MQTDARVDGLLDRWEELHEQGTPLTIEDLCAECPELVAEVRRRIEILREMDSALDTEVQQPRTSPEDRVRGGSGANRELPDVLRATAVYRPERWHARGGLGEVLTARQDELDRTVALKRIRPDKLRDAARRRFLREAAITARLQNPGVVPIYGLGQDEDGPFYTMPFIQGQTLQEAIDAFHEDESLRSDSGRRGLTLRGLLQQFITICNTVAYAHDQGVVHRDLKPSNVMLGPYGETLVMDWGLAKLFGANASTDAGEDVQSPSASHEDVTATGDVLGTRQYMSPEQARGDVVGPASDIFSLGMVLNAILTGKSAFGEPRLRGSGPLKDVREAAMVPPRRKDASLPRALEAISLKALAVRAEDRYPSARALADDVTRWLADEPVSAWREPVSIRTRRWARRHRTAVAVVAVAAAVGVIGLGAVVGVQARANVQLQRANGETHTALAQSEESRKQAVAVSTFLVEAFRSPDPSQDGRQVKVADVLDRASDRLDREFEGSQATLGALLDALGGTYLGLGLYDQAVSRYTRARSVREAALGPVHPDTLASRNNLAIAYRKIGRTDEAIALHDQTLKLRESRLGSDHPDTLSSRNDLAVACWDAGRTAEAIEMYQDTLKRRQSKLGPDHRDTLTSRNNLAIAYAYTGRTDEAIALFEETLKLRESKLGPDHPDTLASHNNLANAYADAGRIVEEIALHEATLKRMQAKLGLDHPDTLASGSNLGLAYMEAGRIVEATALLEETTKLRASKQGSEHPDTLGSRSNLGIAYLAAGRLVEATAALEETLKLRESKLGFNHPDTLTSRGDLANVYESLRWCAKAEDLYRDVVARRKADQSGSPLLATDLAALGHYLLGQFRCLEAEPFLREALALHEKAETDDWRRYDAMSLLGGALLGQGRYADAEPLIVAGYERIKAREPRIAAPERFRVLEAAMRVVRLYEEWNKPDQATAWKVKLGLRDLPADVYARP